MQKIKAKPTIYKGRRYRSQLEAMAAYYMTLLKVPFTYERRSYAVGFRQIYLPDFETPSCFIEVKGGHNERLDKVEKFSRDHIIILLRYSGFSTLQKDIDVNVLKGEKCGIHFFSTKPSAKHIPCDSICTLVKDAEFINNLWFKIVRKYPITEEDI